MSEPSQRMRRVNEAIKEVLSGTISRNLKDPRIGFVTVTGVDTSRDLRHAKVYVSVLGRKEAKEASMAGLRSADGYLQGVINQELHLKRTPALEFLYDESIDQGMRMATLIRHEEEELGIDLEEESPPPNQTSDAASPASGL
jgi:ribosome-binding factor A